MSRQAYKSCKRVLIGYQLGLIPAIATSHGPCVCYARDLCRKLTERCVQLADMNCNYGWCRGGNVGGVFGFFGGLGECDYRKQIGW
jgi:hypothetical protein